MHSAGVVHRDLVSGESGGEESMDGALRWAIAQKPSNILVNENCDLKICDFGLARIQDPQMTGYVSTRYYRAPEIMLTWQKYDVAVDVWSAGCIFAEMLEGRPLFPGKDHVNQFSIITELLGTPPDEVIQTICSENTLRFVQSLPKRERVPFSQKFRNQDPQGEWEKAEETKGGGGRTLTLWTWQPWTCWKRCWCLIHELESRLPRLSRTPILPLTTTQRMSQRQKSPLTGASTMPTCQ